MIFVKSVYLLVVFQTATSLVLTGVTTWHEHGAITKSIVSVKDIHLKVIHVSVNSYRCRCINCCWSLVIHVVLQSLM